jgi:hypothetical protein
VLSDDESAIWRRDLASEEANYERIRQSDE